MPHWLVKYVSPKKKKTEIKKGESSRKSAPRWLKTSNSRVNVESGEKRLGTMWKVMKHGSVKCANVCLSVMMIKYFNVMESVIITFAQYAST